MQILLSSCTGLRAIAAMLILLSSCTGLRAIAAMLVVGSRAPMQIRLSSCTGPRAIAAMAAGCPVSYSSRVHTDTAE
eukprot:scaffold36317_cov177-Isochrysis_galbana.AAC.2